MWIITCEGYCVKIWGYVNDCYVIYLLGVSSSGLSKMDISVVSYASGSKVKEDFTVFVTDVFGYK